MFNTRRLGAHCYLPPTDESGATAIEYALIASFIAAVVAAAVGALGQQVVALFQTLPIPFG
jgi:Flp pilus assembly pilin Flp